MARLDISELESPAPAGAMAEAGALLSAVRVYLWKHWSIAHATLEARSGAEPAACTIAEPAESDASIHGHAHHH